MSMTSEEKKKMWTAIIVALIVAAVIGIGIFLYKKFGKKKGPDPKQVKAILAYVKSINGDPKPWNDAFKKMTPEELETASTIVASLNSGVKPAEDMTAEIQALAKKYPGTFEIE